MKNIILVMLSCVLLMTACNKQNENTMVNVRIDFSGLSISTEAMKTSDQDANGAAVKRIVLSIYDMNDNLIDSYTQNKDTDPTTFGQAITIRIPVGSYKFVAVAHNVAETTDAAATINSATEVSLGALTKLTPTYTKVQEVTIAGNTSQSVVVDFGTRRNALFSVHITDVTPDDVQKLQLIANPTGSDYTNLLVNPATGLAASSWRYSKTYALSEIGLTTFTGTDFGVPLMLTAATQSLTVTINALASDNSVLYTRTLTSVPFQQAHRTLATGTFFSSNSSSSFVFDITQTTDDISLD